jgi:hypothetical protein
MVSEPVLGETYPDPFVDVHTHLELCYQNLRTKWATT